MRGTSNLSAFVTEKNIAVATYRSVTRPFVSWKNNKSPLLVVFGCEFIKVLPKSIVDLKVVGLMAGDVQKSLVTGELKVVARCGEANRFAALPMKITPVAREFPCLNQ